MDEGRSRRDKVEAAIGALARASEAYAQFKRSIAKEERELRRKYEDAYERYLKVMEGVKDGTN